MTKFKSDKQRKRVMAKITQPPDDSMDKSLALIKAMKDMGMSKEDMMFTMGELNKMKQSDLFSEPSYEAPSSNTNLSYGRQSYFTDRELPSTAFKSRRQLQ